MTLALATAPELSRFVENVRSVAPSPGRARRVDRLPDGRTALVVRVIDGQGGDVYAIGPRTRALFKQAAGVERAVMVQFKPGWSVPLLGVPARELTDAYVQLEDLWGGSAGELVSELAFASGTSDVLAGLARGFARSRRTLSEPGSASLARRAVRLLEQEGARVDTVADRLGVTARHLRRAFAENIGVGPKRFARAARLQRAVRLARTSRDWTCIASDAGYYDQAHLIAEFRALVGLTPSAFAKRQREDAPRQQPERRAIRHARV